MTGGREMEAWRFNFRSPEPTGRANAAPGPDAPSREAASVIMIGLIDRAA
jgi:hypothetical protein